MTTPATTDSLVAMEAILHSLTYADGKWHANPAEASFPAADAELAWLHLDRNSDHAEAALVLLEIPEIVREALMATETRPRAQTFGDGLLLLLRGVNLNPGSDPEDMVSLRLWVEQKRIVSVRMRSAVAVQEVREALLGNGAVADAGSVVVDITQALVQKVSGVIETLDDEVDALEVAVVDKPDASIRTQIARLRHQAITLRRYLAPQRDALARAQEARLPWLTELHRAQLRELHDRVIRYVEDLDAVRERGAVVQDELLTRLSDRLNSNMYLLTLVASIMLPLGFVTGLLGVNVDGIPGSQNTPWAFAAVSGALVLVVFVEVWILRRLGWF